MNPAGRSRSTYEGSIDSGETPDFSWFLSNAGSIGSRLPVTDKNYKIAMCFLRPFLRRTVHCPLPYVWSFPNALA
jgi:hypothetical protein